MKIVISGVPCCGKTHFGDWLRDQHGFAHANLEGRRDGQRIIHPPQFPQGAPPWLGTLASNVVVTWGFVPIHACFEVICQFQQEGFTAWWFSANHAVARAKYVKRDGEAAATQCFDLQISRLNQASREIHTIYNGHVVETLTAHGYKALEETWSVIKEHTA